MTLGAEVCVAAPGTLLPDDVASWPVTVVEDFDEALEWADVVGLLRLQVERGTGSFVPSLREFTTTYGLTVERARALRPETIIMHPGPINRGVEIDSRVADLPVGGHRSPSHQRCADSHGRALPERGGIE